MREPLTHVGTEWRGGGSGGPTHARGCGLRAAGCGLRLRRLAEGAQRTTKGKLSFVWNLTRGGTAG